MGIGFGLIMLAIGAAMIIMANEIITNYIGIGPGLGKAKETEKAIIKIVEIFIKQKKPLVIDADAIKPIGEKLDIIKNSKTVVTPHKEEFRKLTGIILPKDIDSKIKIVQEFAEKLSISIFLKGYIDILSNGKKTKINKIHNEAMTVGGTGDVLAGIIGTLLSKGVEPFNAIRIAAFLNGEAGNNAFDKKIGNDSLLRDSLNSETILKMCLMCLLYSGWRILPACPARPPLRRPWRPNRSALPGRRHGPRRSDVPPSTEWPG